eukprot:341292-Amphidinium_carterae.4
MLFCMMAASWMPVLSSIISLQQHAYVNECGLTSALWQTGCGAQMASREHERSLLLALDIDSAFPSVSRQWFKSVLPYVVLRHAQVHMLWQFQHFIRFVVSL